MKSHQRTRGPASIQCTKRFRSQRPIGNRRTGRLPGRRLSFEFLEDRRVLSAVVDVTSGLLVSQASVHASLTASSTS
ncbi:MAG: hypothetical protein ACLP9L_27825, partial [Thermoguttaceae bacterium]